MIPDILTGTERFMRAAGQPIPDVPAIPRFDTIALRIKMLVEELSELCEAVGFEDGLEGYLDIVSSYSADAAITEIAHAEESGRIDLVEMVDAFLDIVVVAHGGVLETAGPEAAEAAAAEVTRSNLDKIVDGVVQRREDGKILKPNGWVGPDIAGVLQRHGGDL